jgi:hypothetical protein
MGVLSDTDKHQARAILGRMFQYGQDGRDLGRYLLAAKHADPPKYPEMKLELLELLSEMLDALYLSPPPGGGS